MKILFVATEMAPFFKVGGLGDVIGTLPDALAKTGLDVSVVIPLYKDIDRDKFQLKRTGIELKVVFCSQVQNIEVWRSDYEGTKVFFIDNNELIGAYDKVAFAGDQKEVDHYAFFSRCVVEWLLMDNTAQGFDVVHLHDWHTGLIPRVYKLLSHNEHRPKFVFTIHNLGYHGFSRIDLVERLGIKDINSIQDDPFFLYDAGDDNELDLLLQGLLSADYITTVSPNYAAEIQTPEYCQGLCTVLQVRSNHMKGILNGLDYNLWDSTRDLSLIENYPNQVSGEQDLLKVITSKQKIKSSLQKDLEINIDPTAMMIGSVGRLDPGQKGLDILYEAIKLLLGTKANAEKTQFVLIGEGVVEWEDRIKSLEKNFPGRVSVTIGFNDDLARKIYAASDLVLIPSKYEPCGLVQMIAMAYGSIPLVRATGGLKDTVIDRENGFVFVNYLQDEFNQKLEEAVLMFFDQKNEWNKLIKNAMNTKFTWDRSAQEYKEIYEELVGD